MLKKLVVCGVGLIGGSFALGLKAAGAVGEVVGVGRTPAPLAEARRRGAIDRVASDWADALRDADLVLLAMPVGQMAPVLAALAPHLAPETIVTDGGSTKCDVVAAARAVLGEKIAQFVPGHPIAGAEKSGVAAAQADLYVDRRVVLTPLAENSGAGVGLVQRAWEACGAKVSRLAAEEHDRVFAAVSHLPHLLAFALVDSLAGQPASDEIFRCAAGGFRDFTRIASSSPEMWRDIAIANRDALLAELRVYRKQLERMEAMLAASDAQGLGTLFATAREARNEWLAGQR